MHVGLGILKCSNANVPALLASVLVRGTYQIFVIAFVIFC